MSTLDTEVARTVNILCYVHLHSDTNLTPPPLPSPPLPTLKIPTGDLYFNVVEDKSPYVETLVCKAIEIYTAPTTNDDEDDDDDGLSEKVLGIVEKMFERCYKERTWTHALGIALEAKNIDKVKEILEKCGGVVEEKVREKIYPITQAQCNAKHLTPPPSSHPLPNIG